MTIKRPSTIILLMILFHQSCVSQLSKGLIAETVKKHSRVFLKDKRFTAVSIALSFKGIDYIGHFGELDKGKSNSPTNKTLYEIASVTKTMTGYLVACAVKEGKFTLESPVDDLLGNDFKNLYFKKEPVRIRHLITHTSGMPLNIGRISKLYEDPGVNNYAKAQKILSSYTKQDFLTEIKLLELEKSPGMDYHYSNTAPNLMAYILETVYEKQFDLLLKEKLLEPALMTNTYINLDEEHQSLLANGYNDKNEQMPNFKKPINLWGAAGRAKSTSADLLNYIKWQLNKENPIIKMSHEKLFLDAENIWIGYYWEVIGDQNDKRIEHHGGLYGSQNWLIIYPENDFGISIISNSSFPEANQLIKKTALNILQILSNYF